MLTYIDGQIGGMIDSISQSFYGKTRDPYKVGLAKLSAMNVSRCQSIDLVSDQLARNNDTA